jgi:hypothetical protein
MRVLVLTSILVFAFAAIGFGQCPTIKVEGPAGPVKAGTTLNYTATLSGGDKTVVPQFFWFSTGGKIASGHTAPKITLETDGIENGTYTVTAGVDGFPKTCANTFGSTTFEIRSPKAGAEEPLPCPLISVSGPNKVSPNKATAGADVVFKANVSGGDPAITPSFEWSVSDGTLSGGQVTSAVTVNTKGVMSKAITATVLVGMYPATC